MNNEGKRDSVAIHFETRPFSLTLEGLAGAEDFGLLQRIILTSNIAVLLQVGLAVIVAVILVPMSALRLAHRYRAKHVIGANKTECF